MAVSRFGRYSATDGCPASTSEQEPQLEHVRRIEAGDAEQRACRRDGGAAGSRPTSSEPRDAEPSRRRLPLDRGDDLVQRGRLPVLDVEAHLDVPRPREAEPERADAREAAVALAHRTRHLPRGLEVVAGEVDVERDQRRRAPTSTPPARSSSRVGPKSGASSPASMRRCSSSGPPRRKNAGPRPAARSA